MIEGEGGKDKTTLCESETEMFVLHTYVRQLLLLSRFYCKLVYITDGFKSSHIVSEKHGTSIRSILLLL